MDKNILMVAWHFPPCGEVSGTLRTLSMARGLRDAGWEPLILAPSTIAYPRRDASLLSDDEFAGRVFRSFALDAKRHLGLFGRYPARFARPDRWASWRIGAVPRGRRLIEKFRPRAVWSTFPIATAHWIAAELQARSGLPWIADFRDPMAYAEMPNTARDCNWQMALEARVIRQASACVFVTEGAREAYQRHYAEHRVRFELIPNGYDENILAARRAHELARVQPPGGPLRLLHSGALYPEGRSPEPLFRVLSRLRAAGGAPPEGLRVTLRGVAGTPEQGAYLELRSRYGLGDWVDFAPVLPRAEALREQLEADGLLLLQGTRFNAQIPAKAYEYLGLGKPVFALVDPDGESARLLQTEAIATVADAGDTTSAAAQLQSFLSRARAARGQPLAPLPERHARTEGAARLARLLEQITGGAA